MVFYSKEKDYKNQYQRLYRQQKKMFRPAIQTQQIQQQQAPTIILTLQENPKEVMNGKLNDV